MLIEDRFFDQEWVQSMSNEDFRMLMYLLHSASKKCGIVELNMRMLNYAANTGRTYTKDEVLKRFAKMLTAIPGHADTAIFHNWIAVNWTRDGRAMDIERNPLDKSIAKELAAYGLTIAKVNAMASAKVEVAPPTMRNTKAASEAVTAISDVIKMFAKFWETYPAECPRKVDKAKCLTKFCSYMAKAKDRDALFKDIMDGLAKWKACTTWTKDGGQFIRAPLVWLNNMNWKDTPANGNANATGNANASYKASDVEGIF